MKYNRLKLQKKKEIHPFVHETLFKALFDKQLYVKNEIMELRETKNRK